MENVIIVFLLFFAVLAAAWFYLQRAKARDAATAGTTATEPAEPVAPAMSDVPASNSADEQ